MTGVTEGGTFVQGCLILRTYIPYLGFLFHFRMMDFDKRKGPAPTPGKSHFWRGIPDLHLAKSS